MATPLVSAKKEPIPSIPLKIFNIDEAVVIKEYLRSRLFTPELLDGLKQLYNCDIQNSKSVVGNITYLNFVIKPNGCNYFIHIKETTYTPKETILSFRFSLKQDDKTITNYEPGFTSTYIVKDNKIQHVYVNNNEDVKPKKSTKKKTILNDRKFVIFFNPYIKLNALLQKQGLRDRINSSTQFDNIKNLILEIDSRKLSSHEKSDLERIQQIFSTQDKKHSYDDRLKEMIHYSYRKTAKRIEEVEQIYENHVLYETNLPVNNMLGNRYAQYYPDFEFNKVIKSLKLNPELPYDKPMTEKELAELMKANIRNLVDMQTNPQLYTRQREEFKKTLKYKYLNHEYIKYIPFGLNRPFTISDLVSYKFPQFAYVDNNLKIVNRLHHSDLSFDAKNIFNLNNDDSISRAFDLIELAKSIMFTYISFYSSIFDKKSLKIPFRLFNVYPKLPWANNVLHENNIIVRAFNPPFLRSLLISIDSTGRDQILTINMKNENKLHKEPINVDYLLPCDEAPFKLMGGIIREPYMSIQELNSVQPVYSGEAHSMTSDGLENEFIENPDVNQRLKDRKHFPIDARHFNQQLASLNINTDNDITEEINPDLPEFQFDEMLSDFPQPKSESFPISEKDEAHFEKIRTNAAAQREITLRLAKEQHIRDEEDEELRLFEAEQLKERELERDKIYAEQTPDLEEEDVMGMRIAKASKESDFKTLNKLYGTMKTKLETTNKQIESARDTLNALQLQPTSDSVNPMAPSYMTLMTPDEKRIKIESLSRQLRTVEENKRKYQEMINYLNKKIDAEKNFKAGKNERRKMGKSGQKDKREISYEESYRDIFRDIGHESYDKKYLKYKAKYLALKQKYNL